MGPTPNRPDWFVQSILIAVRDLDQSVDFYRDVLSLDELFHEGQVAILGSDVANSPALILRQAAAHATRHGQQALGARVVSFNLATRAELDRVEERLGAAGRLVARQRLDDPEQLEIVRGHDPDGLPLVFLTFEGTGSDPTDHYRHIAVNMYGLDV